MSVPTPTTTLASAPLCPYVKKPYGYDRKDSTNRVKGVIFHSPGKSEEKDCIAVKTVSKRKPKRFIFVTSERVKNLVGLYGTFLNK